eukprot:1142766-Pelagomonas_calceolata.AAC.5
MTPLEGTVDRAVLELVLALISFKRSESNYLYAALVGLDARKLTEALVKMRPEAESRACHRVLQSDLGSSDF